MQLSVLISELKNYVPKRRHFEAIEHHRVHREVRAKKRRQELASRTPEEAKAALERTIARLKRPKRKSGRASDEEEPPTS